MRVFQIIRATKKIKEDFIVNDINIFYLLFRYTLVK